LRRIEQFSNKSSAGLCRRLLRHTRPRLVGDLAGPAAIAIALCLLAATPAAAQLGLGGTAAARTSGKPVKQAAEAPDPVLAVVSIARQRVKVYASPGVIAQSPISSGMPGYRTPTGVFSILQRSRYHRSNLYSGAPMPYMQRLTWSGVALHAGVLPGYPASHGCIRLPHHFAVRLWGMTRLGTRVVVAPDDPPVLPIMHPRLPVPRLTPAPEGEVPPVAETGRPEVQVSELSPAAAHTASDVERELPAPRRLLNPAERAEARKEEAAAAVAASAKAARLAAKDSAAKAAAARKGASALRAAEAALAVAQRRHAATTRVAAAATRPATVERAGAALAAAEAKLEEAQRNAENARIAEAALAREAADAAAAAAEAETARRAAAAAIKEAERAAAPLSILVSRKSGKVLIRQAWAPVHEAPVKFADGEFALGTHLYLAMSAAEGGEGLRWVSVSVASQASGASRRRIARQGNGPAALPPPPPDTAEAALSRFELPEETRQFIAERLWTGAALVVSDHAGSETGTYTDFIVQTR
jgi:hypothetical protein